MAKTEKNRHDIARITAESQVSREEFGLGSGTLKVTGILLVSDRDDLLYSRGTVQVAVSGEEVIPEGFHAKLLMSGLGVPPSQRFLPLDTLPGNGKVRVTYTDTPNPALPFAEYGVSLYLMTETDGGPDG